MELMSRRKNSETLEFAMSDDEDGRSHGSHPHSLLDTDESDDGVDADDHSRGQAFSNKLWRTVSNHHDYDFLESTEGFLNNFGDGEPRSSAPPPTFSGGSSDWMPSGRIRLLFFLFLLLSICAILLPNDHQTEETKPIVRKYKGAPQYICPTSTSSSTSEGMTGTTFAGYRNNSQLLNWIAENLTQYKNTFRTLEYMDWNRTYDQVKEGMKQWKSSKYLPSLKKTGASIFESGCGIGLNLLMTLELLQESAGGVRDLHLYGTDFSPAAAIAANIFLDTVLQEATLISGGKRGAVCAADATQLSFIPEHSFDLVFTSHILPTPNPWEVDTSKTNSSSEVIYFNDTLRIQRQQDICQGKDMDWKSQMLFQLAQDRREAFYGRWVFEMIRIAKPGAIVAIEQIPDPTYCATVPATLDLLKWSAGVPPSFWSTGIDRFHWDIDVSSIEIEVDDTLFPNQHHYHVLMKKRRPTD